MRIENQMGNKNGMETCFILDRDSPGGQFSEVPLSSSLSLLPLLLLARLRIQSKKRSPFFRRCKL